MRGIYRAIAGKMCTKASGPCHQVPGICPNSEGGVIGEPIAPAKPPSNIASTVCESLKVCSCVHLWLGLPSSEGGLSSGLLKTIHFLSRRSVMHSFTAFIYSLL